MKGDLLKDFNFTNIKELDHGKNLAGNVKQEFIIEPEMLKSSGLAYFLGKAVQKWIQEIEKK